MLHNSLQEIIDTNAFRQSVSYFIMFITDDFIALVDVMDS